MKTLDNLCVEFGKVSGKVGPRARVPGSNLYIYMRQAIVCMPLLLVKKFFLAYTPRLPSFGYIMVYEDILEELKTGLGHIWAVFLR